MRKFIDFGFVYYDESLKFGTNQENRAYSHAHLDKIKKQCINSLDTMPPITINVLTNHIIDGQHRLKAFQTLVENKEIDVDAKIKVMLVEIPIMDEKQAIIDANRIQRTGLLTTILHHMQKLVLHHILSWTSGARRILLQLKTENRNSDMVRQSSMEDIVKETLRKETSHLPMKSLKELMPLTLLNCSQVKFDCIQVI